MQPPTSSGKSPPAVTVTATATATSTPFPEGSRVPGPGTSDVVATGNVGISKSNSNSSIGVGDGSGDDRLHAGSAPQSSKILPSSPITATIPAIDTVQQTSTEMSPGSVNRIGPSISEIAAIKRRCAASLLAVIPRNVAQTLFGGPSPSNSDCTCSVATGNSSSFTISDSSPPSSLDEGGGGRPQSSLQGNASGPISVAQGTNENNEESNTDLLELYLLDAIERDLLDLLADEYCNKHLVYSIIETVLARVLPELTERSVEDLMEDRGVAPVPGGF